MSELRTLEERAGEYLREHKVHARGFVEIAQRFANGEDVPVHLNGPHSIIKSYEALGDTRLLPFAEHANQLVDKYNALLWKITEEAYPRNAEHTLAELLQRIGRRPSFAAILTLRHKNLIPEDAFEQFMVERCRLQKTVYKDRYLEALQSFTGLEQEYVTFLESLLPK